MASNCWRKRNVGSPSELWDTAKCVSPPKLLGYFNDLIIYKCTVVSDRTIKLCEKYAKVKGPGSIARPEHHPFFQKLAPMVKLHLDKSERENGFMWVAVCIILSSLGYTSDAVCSLSPLSVTIIRYLRSYPNSPGRRCTVWPRLRTSPSPLTIHCGRRRCINHLKYRRERRSLIPTIPR